MGLLEAITALLETAVLEAVPVGETDITGAGAGVTDGGAAGAGVGSLVKTLLTLEAALESQSGHKDTAALGADCSVALDELLSACSVAACASASLTSCCLLIACLPC